MMEIEGGYNEDLRLRDKFGNLTSEKSDSIERLNKIPKDYRSQFQSLSLKFSITKSKISLHLVS